MGRERVRCVLVRSTISAIYEVIDIIDAIESKMIDFPIGITARDKEGAYLA